MSAPTPLEPGRVYDVTIKLRSAAYAFRAGSRIRLSLSEGFWPMLWPSPETPTLTLPMGVSTLTLPVRAPTTDSAFDIKKANGADPAPGYTPATPDASGRLVLTNTQPASPYTVEGPGIELASSGEETCAITQGEPNSAHWRQTTRSSWKRQGWACAVEASYDLTSDATHFRIVETLTATHNSAEIFTRTSDQRIPRDLI